MTSVWPINVSKALVLSREPIGASSSYYVWKSNSNWIISSMTARFYQIYSVILNNVMWPWSKMTPNDWLPEIFIWNIYNFSVSTVPFDDHTVYTHVVPCGIVVCRVIAPLGTIYQATRINKTTLDIAIIVPENCITRMVGLYRETSDEHFYVCIENFPILHMALAWIAQ